MKNKDNKTKIMRWKELERKVTRITIGIIKIALIVTLLLLLAGIFYRPFLYAGLMMLIFGLISVALMGKLSTKDYLAMLWWDRDRK